jgi:Tol biopolymer transport system component
MLWVRRLEKPMKLMMVAVVLAMQLAAQKADPAAVLLEAAARKERVDGNLQAAIAEYRKIAEKYSKQPEVAAQALVKMGECQEKLGEAEARKSYERVVREYAGAGASVVQARARLAAMGAGKPGEPRWVVAEMPNWFTGVPNPTSTDGRFLFFSRRDSNQSWIPALLDLNSGQHKDLTKAPGYSYVDTGVLSADQSMLAYTAQPSPGRLDLIVANSDGSNPKRLYQSNPEAVWFYPIGFSPDKRSIFITFNRAPTHASPGYNLGSLDVGSGALKVLKEIPRNHLSTASVSPDGKWIAYAVRQSEGSNNFDISVLASDLSSDFVIVANAANDSSPIWTADGKGILFVSNRRGTNDAWLAPTQNGKPAGEQKLVRQDLGNVELLGTTPTGTVRYRLTSGSTVFLQSSLDQGTGRFSSFRRLEEEFSGTKGQPKLSSDAKQLAYVRVPDHAKDRAIIGIRDLASGKEREVYPTLQRVRSLTWMPGDQGLLVFGTDHKGRFGDFLVDAETGNTTVLPPDGDLGVYTRGAGTVLVSPDGKTLYFPSFKAESGALFSKELATGATRLLFEGKSYVNLPLLSPDGKWISFWDGGAVGRVASASDGTLRDLGRGLLVTGWSKDSSSIFVWSRRDGSAGKSSAILHRMALSGGEMTPVSDAIENGDPVVISGNVAVYREDKKLQAIWSLDNALAGVK